MAGRPGKYVSMDIGAKAINALSRNSQDFGGAVRRELQLVHGKARKARKKPGCLKRPGKNFGVTICYLCPCFPCFSVDKSYFPCPVLSCVFRGLELAARRPAAYPKRRRLPPFPLVRSAHQLPMYCNWRLCPPRCVMVRASCTAARNSSGSRDTAQLRWGPALPVARPGPATPSRPACADSCWAAGVLLNHVGPGGRRKRRRAWRRGVLIHAVVGRVRRPRNNPRMSNPVMMATAGQSPNRA